MKKNTYYFVATHDSAGDITIQGFKFIDQLTKEEAQEQFNYIEGAVAMVQCEGLLEGIDYDESKVLPTIPFPEDDL
jgi:hypothetical protein